MMDHRYGTAVDTARSELKRLAVAQRLGESHDHQIAAVIVGLDSINHANGPLAFRAVVFELDAQILRVDIVDGREPGLLLLLCEADEMGWGYHEVRCEQPAGASALLPYDDANRPRYDLTFSKERWVDHFSRRWVPDFESLARFGVCAEGLEGTLDRGDRVARAIHTHAIQQPDQRFLRLAVLRV